MNFSFEGFEKIPFKEDDLQHPKRGNLFGNMLRDIVLVIKVFFALLIFYFILMGLKHGLTPQPAKLFLSYLNETEIYRPRFLRLEKEFSYDHETMMFFRFPVELRQPVNQTTIIQSIEVHTQSNAEVTEMINHMSSYNFNKTSELFILSGRLLFNKFTHQQCYDIDEPDGHITISTQIFINVGEGKAQRVGFSKKHKYTSCCVRFCTPL